MCRKPRWPALEEVFGCAGRQVVDGQPVAVLGELSQVGGLVDVEVVPDEHDRAAELLVCGDQQVSVVAPGVSMTESSRLRGWRGGGETVVARQSPQNARSSAGQSDDGLHSPRFLR